VIKNTTQKHGKTREKLEPLIQRLEMERLSPAVNKNMNQKADGQTTEHCRTKPAANSNARRNQAAKSERRVISCGD
jgi:hypothetical protein